MTREQREMLDDYAENGTMPPERRDAISGALRDLDAAERLRAASGSVVGILVECGFGANAKLLRDALAAYDAGKENGT